MDIIIYISRNVAEMPSIPRCFIFKRVMPIWVPQATALEPVFFPKARYDYILELAHTYECFFHSYVNKFVQSCRALYGSFLR